MILYTRSEVAALLNVTEKWLVRAAERGDGPAFIRLSAGAIRYPASSLNEWLGSRCDVTPRKCNRISRRQAA